MIAKLKIMTIVGTRPELIRLACLIEKLDQFVSHTLVHTGQNTHEKLGKIFFEDLGIREPDIFLHCNNESAGKFMGDVLSKIDSVFAELDPDAVVILGDTNSAVSAIVAERRGIPVYHLEAGNRSFDPRVPEELNRKLVDHVSSYNLPYNDYSLRNLLAEGVHPRTICKTGSPLPELVNKFRPEIEKSHILQLLKLDARKYFVASVHRQENVDSKNRLQELVNSLIAVSENWELPVVVSVHPRTRKRLVDFSIKVPSNLIMLEPLGFLDYNKLQLDSKAVLSDSGTVAEEASILGFPAITLRESMERPESLSSASLVVAGIEADNVLRAVDFAITNFLRAGKPEGYDVSNFSDVVVNFILSNVSYRRLLNAAN